MRLTTVVFAALFLHACNAAPIRDTTPHITVVGSASEEVAPDEATIAFSIVTERRSAEEATNDNATAAQAVISELYALGVDEKDIQTARVSLAPFVNEERDPRTNVVKRVQKGFRARNELRATVKKIGDVGNIAQRIVEKGANAIDNIGFDLSDARSRLDSLRAEAIRNAKHQAEIYVEAIGMKLGKALEIAPEPDEGPAPRPFAERAAFQAAKAGDAAPIPIEPGLRKLSTRVTVTFAISR